MNAPSKTDADAGLDTSRVSPDPLCHTVDPQLPVSDARTTEVPPAFEEEIEVYFRMPPKKSVPLTAVVLGRSKAKPRPILDC